MEVDSLYSDMADRNGFGGNPSYRQILLESYDGNRDNEELIYIEQSLSGQLRYFSDFLDSEKDEEN